MFRSVSPTVMVTSITGFAGLKPALWLVTAFHTASSGDAVTRFSYQGALSARANKC